MEELFSMEPREAVYKCFKMAWKSFYKSIVFMILLIVLAACAGTFIPYVKEHPAISKWIWIAVVVIDLLLFLRIVAKRAMMSLILRDNPEKPEDREIAYVLCNPLKPFSPDFRRSIEISLANIVDIRVRQTMMQTILGIGDIVITSSGTAQAEILAENIPNPDAVRDEIQVHARYHAA